MKRILLLSNSGFPQKFNSVDIDPPSGMSRREFLEQQTLASINNFNNKLNVEEIMYVELKEFFPHVNVSKFAGLIVEDIVINEELALRASESGSYVYSNGNETLKRNIMMYVFLTDSKEDSRNIFVSQSIFPALIDYMEQYKASPSYSISNHPIYFINIVNKEITANSIISPLSAIIAAGFNYIEVFPTSINPKKVPSNLKDFLLKYREGYDISENRFNANFYEVDFNQKELKIKTEELLNSRYIKEVRGNMEFNGSSEKFYWMEVVPIFLIGIRNGYKVDFEELEDFCTTYKDEFSSSSGKFPRFEYLLRFMKKLTFNGVEENA